MNFKIQVNNEEPLYPEVQGRGFLGAHIVFHQNNAADVSIKGYNTNDEACTKYLTWNKKVLKKGDVVSIEVLPDTNKTSPPDQTQLSSKMDSFNVSDPKVADEILKHAFECNSKLQELFKICEINLDQDEFKTMRQAIGRIIANNFDELIAPIYRKYPEKRPDDQKDQPL
ncbi:MAG: hypothetical protein MRY83_10850 [Flavobacteriales bacterium]|nr:hypothetical protein [Flavobacteriales bacterium]